MHLDFFAYLKRIELLAFFPGYVLWYVIIKALVDIPALTNFKNLFSRTLPYGYALICTLYLGLQLRNFYSGNAIVHLNQMAEFLLFQIWALLGLLFWLPGLARKPLLSFLHSIVFFLIIVQDLFLYLRNSKSPDLYDVFQNDMRLFTISLLLNLLSFSAVLAISLIFQGRTGQKHS